MARMAAGGGGHGPGPSDGKRAKISSHTKKSWANTAETSKMWKLIHEGETKEIHKWLSMDQEAALMRSKDGRGPLWWAYEAGRTDIVRLLKAAGARDDARDGNGVKPSDLQ